MRVAVVGHVEWMEFVRLPRVPVAGEIVHGDPLLQVPAGGGGVAAVQLARWTGDCRFFTVFGDDELGHRAADGLRALGVTVHATFRKQPQRRGLSLIDAQRERTLLIFGDRMNPHAEDDLPWDELDGVDAVYVTGGDTKALQHARRARVVVATSRFQKQLREAAIPIDVLVGSANDRAEHYTGGLDARVVVRTDGSRGGTFQIGNAIEHYAPVPFEVTGDTYGAGDTFAAGLTLALGEGLEVRAACEAAARRATEALDVIGPYR